MKTYSIFTSAVVAAALFVTAQETALAQILEVPTQYPTIQAAVDAAPDGASITVLSGAYAPFEIVGKSLSVHGTGLCPFSGSCATGVDILQASPTPGLIVRDLPAGGQVLVSGMRFRTVGATGTLPGVLIEDCSGTVLMADVVIRPPSTPSHRLFVRNSDLVVLDRVEVRAKQGGVGEPAGVHPAVRVSQSTVWAANSTFIGGGGGSSVGNCYGDPAGPAIVAQRSTLYLAACQIVGGNGGTLVPLQSQCGFGHPKPGGPGGPGIQALESVIKLVSGEVSGGIGGCGGNFPGVPAAGGVGIDAIASSTLVAGTATVVGGREGCDIGVALAASYLGGVFHLVSQEYPTLAAGPGPFTAGSTVAFDVAGEANAPGLIVVSLRSGPVIALPGIDGAGLVGLAHIALFVPVVLDGSGAAAWTLPLPALAQLAGMSIVAQAVVLGPQFPAFTNPVVIAGAP